MSIMTFARLGCKLFARNVSLTDTERRKVSREENRSGLRMGYGTKNVPGLGLPVKIDSNGNQKSPEIYERHSALTSF